MLAVKVDQLFLSNLGFVVLLKGARDGRSLPVFIGAAEAQAIAFQMNKVQVPRPLTHDLLKNVLDFLECRLKRVEVCDLKEGTFYARLVFERDARELEIDSRPSDAIALALRVAAPIFVAESVMDEAGRDFSKLEAGAQPGDTKRGEEEEDVGTQKALSPLDLLSRRLEKAVKEERYEDAARLRDEIKQIKGSHTDN